MLLLGHAMQQRVKQDICSYEHWCQSFGDRKQAHWKKTHRKKRIFI